MNEIVTLVILEIELAPKYNKIIPTPHRYGCLEQIDWLEETFYTSINSMSRNLGSIFLLPAPKTQNDDHKNMNLMSKLEL